MSLWEAIGRQLKTPQGAAGKVVGLAMRVVNDAPNRLAVAALGVRPLDRVLEIGFGPGHGIKLLSSRARAGCVYGVDLSPVMLAQAIKRNRAAVQTRRVRLWQGNFDALPLDDHSVDKVLAVNVAYFWRDPCAILAEVRRVLRPGGAISIYVTDSSTLAKWRFAGSETHRHYDSKSIARFLKQSGFRDASIRVETISLAWGVDGLFAVAYR